MQPHRFPVRVYYEDTDLAGIVYYANYLKYVERARTEWVRDLGIDQNELKEAQDIVFAVRKVEATYLSPAKFDDELDVETSLEGATAVRIILRQIVKRGDRVLFDALVTLVTITTSGELTRVPQSVRMALKA